MQRAGAGEGVRGAGLYSVWRPREGWPSATCLGRGLGSVGDVGAKPVETADGDRHACGSLRCPSRASAGTHAPEHLNAVAMRPARAQACPPPSSHRCVRVLLRVSVSADVCAERACWVVRRAPLGRRRSSRLISGFRVSVAGEWERGARLPSLRGDTAQSWARSQRREHARGGRSALRSALCAFDARPNEPAGHGVPADRRVMTC